MIEYRFNNLPIEFEELLIDMGACIVQEDFKNGTFYVVYSIDNMDELFSAFNIAFTSKDVEETGWQDKWKEYIKEGWLNNSIYYIFEPKTFSDNRTTIYINPSLAFGTGTHATTQIAGRLIESVCLNNTMLDIGTGSGILSIAASLLGAKNIYAFDIDQAAISNTKENIFNNNVHNIYTWAGDISSVKRQTKFDIVCANIISSVLLEITKEASFLSDKYIIYSGILSSEYNSVIKQLIQPGWEEDSYININEWCGVRLKKKE